MFLLTVFIFFYFLYQNNLKNRELWLRVTNMMETLDYAPPVLVIENDDLVEDEYEEAFEEW